MLDEALHSEYYSYCYALSCIVSFDFPFLLKISLNAIDF